MKCDKCNAPIESGDGRSHRGQTLCEDCYMDALSPVKPCDPWAVYSAKSMNGNASALTKLQQKILNVLKETEGIELEPLAEKLGLELSLPLHTVCDCPVALGDDLDLFVIPTIIGAY